MRTLPVLLLVAMTKACTVEQITAMVRAGFSDEQIRAACPQEG